MEVIWAVTKLFYNLYGLSLKPNLLVNLANTACINSKSFSVEQPRFQPKEGKERRHAMGRSKFLYLSLVSSDTS